MKKIYHLSMTVDEEQKKRINERLEGDVTLETAFTFHEVRRWGTEIPIFISIVTFCLSLFFWLWVCGTYRDGQVDALSGKVLYELVVRSDSSRVWEKK